MQARIELHGVDLLSYAMAANQVRVSDSPWSTAGFVAPTPSSSDVIPALHRGSVSECQPALEPTAVRHRTPAGRPKEEPLPVLRLLRLIPARALGLLRFGRHQPAATGGQDAIRRGLLNAVSDG